MTSRGPRWTEDEARVLVAIFFNSRFSLGDDNRDECRLIADCFGRSPSSIDRQWRNIAALTAPQTNSHIGQLIEVAVHEFLDDPGSCKLIAVSIAERRSWPLRELILGEGIDDAFSEMPDEERSSRFRNRVAIGCSSIDYKIFPGGSHGFAVDNSVSIDSREDLLLKVTSVLSGSRSSEFVDMKCTRDEQTSEVLKLVENAPIRVSRLGRLTLYVSAKVRVGHENFRVSVWASESGGGINVE